MQILVLISSRSLESILSSYFLHIEEKERLCYCSHKLFIGVSLQNMQSCFAVYQVFLQPGVIQIKACKPCRLQILPWVRFPQSTVIMPVTVASANTIFRSGCCPSICVCLPRAWKVFVAVSRFLLAWCVMLWQVLQHSHPAWPVSLTTITCRTNLSSPLSPPLSQHSTP